LKRNLELAHIQYIVVLAYSFIGGKNGIFIKDCVFVQNWSCFFPSKIKTLLLVILDFQARTEPCAPIWTPFLIY
jgi:hypothetical protein